MYNSNTFSIMGKTSSMWGKTTGKIGGLVYATAGGEQIVREYNPNVSNPSTDAQVNARAKMKLLSQLSATLSPIIAMTKDGLVSKRNKFTSRNYNYAIATNGVAQISYENVQLTEGNLALPQITGSVQDAQMTVYFATAPSANIKRVVWACFRKTDENNLEFVKSVIISTREETPGNGMYFLWDTDINVAPDPYPDQSYVFYAYGMVDTSAQATARYGDLSVENATDIARLVTSRAISYQDFQLTQTRGATWERGQTAPTFSGSSADPNKVRVYVTAAQGGTVSGAGLYDLGATVTLTATPDSGYEFVKWQINGGGDYATKNPVTFTANEMMDLVAIFKFVGNDTL